MNIVLYNLTLALHNIPIEILLQLFVMFFFLHKCMHVFGPHWTNELYLFIYYYLRVYVKFLV